MTLCSTSASSSRKREPQQAADTASHPSAVQCMGMMEGQWKLVYTTNTQTLMMLNAIDALPLVDIGNVYQVVDAQSMTASNKVGFCFVRGT